jgi:glycogen(starch) synthase
MKILMTADAVGGVWTYAVQLGQLLAGNGVEVLVATMGPRPSDKQRQQIATIRRVSVCESDFKLEWMAEPWRDVERAGNWLLGLEESYQPDVVHLNGYAHGALDWKAPTLMVAHSCVLSWWEAVKGEAAPAGQWGIYRERVTAGLHAADYVVAPTKFMLDRVRQLYGRCSEMSVIPNGRDPNLFRSVQKKEPFVVSAGRVWDEAKNIAALDRIADDVDWPVCVAGSSSAPDGKAGTDPSKLCISLGQLDHNAFADFLGRAAIFCLPARYEPFGLSILEAALSRCALVVGDITSLRETWDGAALFVDPENDDAIATALNTLIHDPVKRAELARCGHERALSFTALRMADHYLAVYKLLSGPESNLQESRENACAS